MDNKWSSHLSAEFEIKEDFQPFNQKNDIFNRSLWDSKINPKLFFASYDLAKTFKKSKGFDHWDYALRNASWHLTDHVGEVGFDTKGTVEGFTDYYTTHRPGPDQKAPDLGALAHTTRIKQAAKIFGAGMVGICRLDRRFLYSHHFNRKTGANPVLQIPDSLQYAIVLILPMDYSLSRTFPSALSGTTTGVGYMQSLGCATQLAQFITNLGYEAIASMNDTALNIPLAIEAGLGEYGRHGLLITPNYGPNVRIAKVLTDLPLSPDAPRSFGVKEFCQICRKCASSCPARAIPDAEPQAEPPNISSHKGIKKWTVNAEKCFRFWVGMNTDCAICIRVCPYHKNYSKWYHRIGTKLAGSPFRKLMLWLHDVFSWGERKDPVKWWQGRT
ncbi:MAG: reductive dehalogenase [Saprospiraceae bacterium]|nr:reductive dehalogenase [Saprospiraceae bacterium]